MIIMLKSCFLEKFIANCITLSILIINLYVMWVATCSLVSQCYVAAKKILFYSYIIVPYIGAVQ